MKPTPKQNFDVSRAVCKQIHQAIEPAINVLGTQTFGYHKFFSNGSSFGISNNVKWIDFCLTHFAETIISHDGKEVRGALTDEKHCYFRVTPLNSQDAFLSALYDLNIFSLYRKTAHGVEAFYFTSTRDNESLIVELSAPLHRYKSATISYSLGISLFGGTAPLVAAWLTHITQTPWLLAAYFNCGGLMEWGLFLCSRAPQEQCHKYSTKARKDLNVIALRNKRQPIQRKGRSGGTCNVLEAALQVPRDIPR